MKKKNINIRIDEDVYQTVSEVADRHGKSMSEIVRLSLMNDIEKITNQKSYSKQEYNNLIELMKTLSNTIAKHESELNHIGRNINQLAKYTNQVRDDRYINKNTEILENYLRQLDGQRQELKEISRRAWELV